MRLFLSCQQALKPQPAPAYAFWEFYFKSALAEGGHEVIQAPGVDWAEGLTRLTGDERAAWLSRTWSRTVDFLRAEHATKPVALFLSYLFPDQVDPSALRSIREMGIPTVNFFCDNVREFTRVPEAFRPFDMHWVPEAEARALYTAAAMPFLYAPMPMWVGEAYRSVPSLESDETVFIGSKDDLREDLLGEAVERGLDLRVRGPGWADPPPAQPGPARGLGRTVSNQLQFLGREGLRGLAMRSTYQFRKRRPTDWIPSHAAPAVSNEAYFAALREARVSIGINRCPSFRRPFSRPLKYSRLRDIEAPMLGACYLAESAPGLEDLYDLGIEIETFATASELAEKASSLSKDAPRRARLRQAGQRRALAEHTIGRSLERIAKALGLTA